MDNAAITLLFLVFQSFLLVLNSFSVLNILFINLDLLTCSIVVFSETYNCSTDCPNSDVICNSGSDCSIICPTENACKSKNLYCAASEYCSISCTGKTGCKNSKIIASSASALSVKCQSNAINVCQLAEIQCPIQNSCDLECIGDKSCNNAIVNATFSSYFNLSCIGVADNCALLQVFTSSPTIMPTSLPSYIPTQKPSFLPTDPSLMPSVSPSTQPSNIPSLIPSSVSPSIQPSIFPAITPSNVPSLPPSLFDVTDIFTSQYLSTYFLMSNETELLTIEPLTSATIDKQLTGNSSNAIISTDICLVMIAIGFPFYFCIISFLKFCTRYKILL